MKDKTIAILQFFFGKTPSQAFGRLMAFAGLVIIGAMLVLNLGFKIPVGGGFIEWKPMDVKIDYKKGQ